MINSSENNIARLGCATCLFKLAVDVVQRYTDDDEIAFQVIRGVLKILESKFKLTAFLPRIAMEIYELIESIVGNADVYEDLKKQSNELALRLVPFIKEDLNPISDVNERIKRSMSAAIVGNIIDFGTPAHTVTLDEEYIKILYSEVIEKGMNVQNGSIPEFITRIKGGKFKTCLYIADNAGEIVFDKLLIDELIALGVEVTLCVKGRHISNDATIEDARIVWPEMESLINPKIITTGSNYFGVFFDKFSDEFIKIFKNSDFIIAKGQANFESLIYLRNQFNNPTLLLFRAKCSPIARFSGVKLGENVLIFLNFN